VLFVQPFLCISCSAAMRFAFGFGSGQTMAILVVCLVFSCHLAYWTLCFSRIFVICSVCSGVSGLIVRSSSGPLYLVCVPSWFIRIRSGALCRVVCGVSRICWSSRVIIGSWSSRVIIGSWSCCAICWNIVFLSVLR